MRDYQRGQASDRKYGYRHKQLRASWVPVVATGTVLCARCGKAIAPGQEWDLGHIPSSSEYRGPEHRHPTGTCAGNRSTSGTERVMTRAIEDKPRPRYSAWVQDIHDRYLSEPGKPCGCEGCSP